MGRFKNDYLLPMFIDNRATNITIQFEATDEKSRSITEAKQIASRMIPKDAKLEKEYTQKDMPSKVMLYHSNTIAKLFPDWEPAGKFLVIYGYEEGNENGVFSIVIGIGDNP